MSEQKKMSQIFEKLEDLKTLFIYGQKVVPILQSLIDFMQDTVPLLENINKSIADSTSKMPKVKNQIDNVTCATELATTEILDLVDKISNEVSVIEKNFNDITKREIQKNEILKKIKFFVKDNPEAEKLFQEYSLLNGTEEYYAQTLDELKKIKDDAYYITISLQVQDITSQQLAAINHLIETVNARLTELMVDMKETNLDDHNLKGISVPAGATFDPNANYTNTRTHQEIADELINGGSEKASQSEIDKLFS